MKKLIAILVVFALATGFVFAEATVSGFANSKFKVIGGKTGEWDTGIPENATENKIGPASSFAGAYGWDGRIALSGESEKFAGYVRLNRDGGNNFAWASWKPFDALKITAGHIGGDGAWGQEGVTGWGFHEGPYDDMGFLSNGSFINLAETQKKGSLQFGGYNNSAFYGGTGWGQAGLFFEITPMDMLSVNIGFPVNETMADKVYTHLHAQVNLKLDFANISLSFVGNDALWNPDTSASQPDPSPVKAYLYFGMPINDQFSFDVGVGFPFPVSHSESGYTATYQAPIGIGLGLKFATDSFGIKLRANFEVGEQQKESGGGYEVTYDSAVSFNADLLPYFSIGDSATLFISLGLQVIDPNVTYKLNGTKIGDTTLKAVTAFYVNPYIVIGDGTGKFMAGIKMWGVAAKDAFTSGVTPIPGGVDAKGNDYINLSIPVGIFFNF